MTKHRIYSMSFASVYPHYVAKAERKGRTKAEVDQIIAWLTGYGAGELQSVLDTKMDFETFFAQAPALNPSRALVFGRSDRRMHASVRAYPAMSGRGPPQVSARRGPRSRPDGSSGTLADLLREGGRIW